MEITLQLSYDNRRYKIKTTKILICVLLILGFVLSAGCIETGKGTSVDTLYGLENDGLIWKTWSVWLTNDHPYTDHSAIYSISNQNIALIEQIQNLSGTDKKVKVYYRNVVLYYPWDYSSDTIIYKVEPIP